MFFQPRTDHIGLDISDHSFKAVQLKKGLRGSLKLVGVGNINIAEGTFNDGDLKQPDSFIKAVNDLIAKPTWGKFTSNLIVACLPESKTFIKMIDIPVLTNAEVEQAVKWEAEHHIPLPFEETYWDWQKIELAPNIIPNRQPVILAVSPKNIVDSYSQALSRAHLTCVAMEIEAQAIVRSLIPTNSRGEKNATIIIDIGADHTSLIMFSLNTIQFTVSLPISGNLITKTIAQTLNLEETLAEEAKIKYGLDSQVHHGAIYKILQDMITDLIHRLRESLTFYSEHFPHNPPVGEILLCGGAANCKSIDKLIQAELKIPVKLGNPWSNITPSPNQLSAAESLSYTTAIGLALRGLI
ncbi:MAG: type IV pilus assembly protein PilM [Candidatus Kerfeldbacteria bacterium]|nr:type IV pilus assembly protein PilM [Candidatus Kerfeldbacteria bacterium]